MPEASASVPQPRSAKAVRWIELARAGWGAALLVRPREVLRRVHGLEADKRSIAVARVLGVRHLAQALLSGIRPSPEVLAMGVWVDAVHASTALGLAVVDPSRARAGLTDTAVAALWSAAGLRDLTRGGSTAPEHERLRDALARGVLHRAPGGGALLARADAERRRDGTSK